MSVQTDYANISRYLKGTKYEDAFENMWARYCEKEENLEAVRRSLAIAEDFIRTTHHLHTGGRQ